MGFKLLSLAARLLVLVLIVWGLHVRPGGLAPVGNLFDPLRGLYANARLTDQMEHEAFNLVGLDSVVTIERDERGVPHIFAASQRDAIQALGYVVAQDRLFQMDFISKLAAGRLSEIFGPASIETDRYLRSIGMDWAAKRNANRIEAEASTELDVVTWFGLGANAVIDNLSYAELPFEFKLFGYRPDRYSALHAARLIQYFNFDLSFNSDEAEYGELLDRLGRAEYDRLYPRHSTRYHPIIPDFGLASGIEREARDPLAYASARHLLQNVSQQLRKHGFEGFVHGKGSNNWAVGGARSTTGKPLLAGDIHLSLSLPSIWYEAHLATDSLNVYGVLAPGTPLLVQALNDHVAWTFTNSGLDGIDHYVLELEEAGRHYNFDGQWRPLIRQLDTLHIKGSPPVIDTLLYTHLGPVLFDSSAAIALRWVAHEENTTLRALWELQTAQNAVAVDSALRHWHSPAQNVLFSDVHGQIGLRVAGVIPIRRHGHGVGLMDGTTSATDWIGVVDFEDVPHVMQPDRGYLTSTNQQPTRPDYPHYVGHDWPAAFRSLRIDSLLNEKQLHSLDDFRQYQSDVKVVQHAMLLPLIAPVEALSEEASVLKAELLAWDGRATLDSQGALVLFEFLRVLKALTWDETAFEGMLQPTDMILLDLLYEDDAIWLDVQTTSNVENTESLLRLALEETAHVMRAHYGMDPAGWRWGEHHQLWIRHMTQTPALSALWRRQIPYPGFDETLAPGDNLVVTHSASWRVIVDFSTTPPSGQGMYAGGQQGNPLSQWYDAHLDDYVAYRYNELHRPRQPGELSQISSTLILAP